MALRDTLNQSNLNQVADALKAISNGELLTLVIAGLTPTETGVVPSSNVATLAQNAVSVFQVNATTGTVTGIKKLLRGPISGEDAVVPATGECVWDGGKKILFAAVDAVTAVSITYTKADLTQKASILLRNLDQTGS